MYVYVCTASVQNTFNQCNPISVFIPTFYFDCCHNCHPPSKRNDQLACT